MKTERTRRKGIAAASRSRYSTRFNPAMTRQTGFDAPPDPRSGQFEAYRTVQSSKPLPHPHLPPREATGRDPPRGPALVEQIYYICNNMSPDEQASLGSSAAFGDGKDTPRSTGGQIPWKPGLGVW
jgi:hypothetical protein